MFLRATFAGFRGVLAGRCGFRYRRRPESMLIGAMERADLLKAQIRGRYLEAFEPEALIRREHEEMPRFALVRCDRGDVLLTSSCELEPRRLTLTAFARSLAAAGGPDPATTDYVPAITVLTGSGTIGRLEEAGQLAAVLSGFQREMRGKGVVGLRIGPPDAPLSAIAVRASALAGLAVGVEPTAQALVEVDGDGGRPGDPLPAGLSGAGILIGSAMLGEGMPLSPESHSIFFEHLHIEDGAADSDAEPAAADGQPA